MSTILDSWHDLIFVHFSESSRSCEVTENKLFNCHSLMGCSTSGPRVSGRVASRPVSPLPLEKSREEVYFDELTDGVQRISKPPGVNPTLCIGANSFPIVCERMYLNERVPGNVNFPIVAGATLGRGRVVCFGSIEYLSNDHLKKFGTGHLIYNCIRWLVNRVQTAKPALCLSLPNELLADCRQYFHKHGVTSEIGDENTDISDYDLIITNSSIGNRVGFIEFVEKGGGLMLFCDNELKSFTKAFGISFAYCPLSLGDPSSAWSGVAGSFQLVKHLTFEETLKRYHAELSLDVINSEILDCLVSSLRFFLSSSSFEVTQSFLDAVNKSFEYLHKDHFIRDGVLCSELSHAVVVAFLVHSLPKCPFERITYSLPTELFPGNTGEVVRCNVERNISVTPYAWFSVGVWIEACCEVKVSVDEPRENLWIQIGSHDQNLLVRTGNWRRWPKAVNLFPLNQKVITISSWLGGLVYLVTGRVTECDVRLSLDGVCDAPVVSIENRPLHSFQLPWVDVDIGNAKFTVPSPCAERITGVQMKRLSVTIDEIVKFTNYLNVKRPYRVVFDVDVSETNQLTYPLVFHVNDIDNIITETPTTSLCDFLTRLALASISEECFDDVTELAVAQVAACSAMLVVFPGTDVMNLLPQKRSNLVKLLWTQHMKRDSSVLPQVIAAVQTRQVGTSLSGDLWHRFVLEMCKYSRRNLVDAFASIKPIASCVPCNPEWPVDSLDE